MSADDTLEANLRAATEKFKLDHPAEPAPAEEPTVEDTGDVIARANAMFGGARPAKPARQTREANQYLLEVVAYPESTNPQYYLQGRVDLGRRTARFYEDILDSKGDSNVAFALYRPVDLGNRPFKFNWIGSDGKTAGDQEQFGQQPVWRNPRFYFFEEYLTHCEGMGARAVIATTAKSVPKLAEALRNRGYNVLEQAVQADQS